MSVQRNRVYSKPLMVVQLLFVMCWLSNLRDTDSFYSIYVLCGLVGAMCLLDNYMHDRLLLHKGNLSSLIFAGVFSFATILANYQIFIQIRNPQEVSGGLNLLLNLFNGISSLVGGTVTAFHFLVNLCSRLPMEPKCESVSRKHSGRVFLLSYVSIAAIYLVYLFVCRYPGNLTPDSINQITQCYTGEYINNHPFWHTIMIKGILHLGYGIRGNIIDAVGFFSLCQGLFMAGCFSYVIVTLYQAGVPKWFVGLCWCIYALTPYHISYSATMWKDVVFGCAAVLIVTSLLRIMQKMGKKQIGNYVVFCFGSIGLCLWRTNGLLAYIMSALIFVPYFWKRNRKLVWIMIVVILVCWLLTGPFLTFMGVGTTDIVEGFSIPLQQMARVVAEGCSLTREETELLSRIFDMEEMAQIYSDWISDPVKNEVRENDAEYFRQNLGQYIRLWLQLGGKYPGVYLKAWVDQTKGYWNGGYFYFPYSEMMYDNPFGIVTTAGQNILARLVKLYFNVSSYCLAFEPLMSIGLHVWIVAICCFVNLQKRRKEFLLCVPGLVIVLGLLIGTPVFSEFRYAYPLVAACPMILGVTFWNTRNEIT